MIDVPFPFLFEVYIKAYFDNHCMKYQNGKSIGLKTKVDFVARSLGQIICGMKPLLKEVEMII